MLKFALELSNTIPEKDEGKPVNDSLAVFNLYTKIDVGHTVLWKAPLVTLCLSNRWREES